MLLKSHISSIEIHSDEWHQGRLGRFTASEMYLIMGEKWPTDGALKYVYRKAGEEVSGLAYRDEIDVASTRHGILYETEGLQAFGARLGLKFIVAQKLISDPETRFGCTPDGLIVRSESSDGLSYDVTTVEIKCPMNYSAYVELFLCETPEDLKKVSKHYFYQVISQMDICNCLQGYFVCYQPYFKSGGLKVIEFRKVKLVNEFKLMQERKQLALDKFDEVRQKLLSA